MDTIEELISIERELAFLHKQCIYKLLLDCDIHPGQPPILFTLRGMGKCSQTELAKKLHCSPASVAVSLKRLEKAGHINRETDPDDARTNSVELTESGEHVADLSEQMLRKTSECMLMGITQSEREQLLSALKHSSQNLRDLLSKLNEKERSI